MPWVLRGEVLRGRVPRCPAAGEGSVPVSRGVLSGSPEQGWFRRSSGSHVSGGLRGMQVETLASVVVVVRFFSQCGRVLGLVSLSLPPSDSFSFASPCLHLHVTRCLGERARVTPLHPIASGQRGAQAGGPRPGPPPGGGSPPQLPPTGFGEKSEHGEHVVLAPKGTELGALGISSRQHPHRRQSAVQPPACGARPLPPPLRPRPAAACSRFLII